MSVSPIRLHDDPTVNAERQVLAAVMSDARVLDDLDLNVTDFHDPRHEQLFDLLTRMRGDGEALDYVTVTGRLASQPIRGLGQGAVAEIYSSLITSANAGYHAEMVSKAAALRRVTAVAERILYQVGESDDPAGIVDMARGWLDKLTSTGSGPALVSMADAVDEAIDRVAEPAYQHPTPWPELNLLIGGWRPGRVYVVGARPGSGKSIVGGNVALYHARRSGSDVAITSMEMDRPELTQRSLCALASVDFRKFQFNDCTEQEWGRITAARAHVEKLNVFVDDRASIHPGDVRWHARQVARRGNLGMVVVDYLQLMETGRRSENRQQEVAGFSRAMKILARDLNVPVVVLSQLNRGSELRSGAPRLADLRDSGAVEQDADVVLLLHRDDAEPEWLSVIVPKNRQGPTGAFSLKWEGRFMRVGEGWAS